MGIGIIHKDIGQELTGEEFHSQDLHRLLNDAEGTVAVSNPPGGAYRVLNIYVIKVDGAFRLEIEYDDTPVV